jgi:hypothetical protein
MALVLLLLAPDFVNVADQAGLSGHKNGRAVFVHLDADARLDVVLDKQHFFLQRGGKFVKVAGLPAAADIVLFADFDNDGKTDCFAGADCHPELAKWKDHGRSNAIYLNDGKGGWKAVDPGMPRTWLAAACTLDFDRDGNLDLYLGSWYRRYPESLACYPDRLYRGRGDGTFEDVTKDSGLLTAEHWGRRDSSKPTYGLTHGDWNNDGWQDLWVCTYGRQWNFLWRNDKGARFIDVGAATTFDGDKDRSGTHAPGVNRPQERPFRANGNTFDCAVADFDNDGDMDCILAEITHWWAGSSSDLTSLLVNLGPKEGFRFERRPDAFPREHTADRWNQGDIHCGWIDFDNDGLLDALIASSDYADSQELKLYRQRSDHTFEPARTFGWEGAAQLSVGDYDNDGDEDILVGRSLNRLPKARRAELGVSCALFRNDIGNKNHWLQVVCRGKSANRDGIGCRIEVTTADGVTQTREIRGGLGHAGHSGPHVAHFGLGAHTKAQKVVVRWPDRAGSVKTLTGVAADQRRVVHQ